MADQDKAQETATDTAEAGPEQDVPPTTDAPDDDIEKKVQAEVDRRLTAAMEKREKKLRAEMDAKLEAEKKKAEEERLKEQGKWQEVAESTQAELDALRAEQARAKFTSEARAKLKEANLTAFEDVLLQPLETVDGVTKAADMLKSLLDERIEAEITQRLHTADRPTNTGGSNGAPSGDPTKWSIADKTAYIAEHGGAAYQALLDKRK
jgi:hypothetical protein